MVSTVAANKEGYLVIRTCYGVKKGENVAILTDEDHMQEARALAAGANEVGANCVIVDASAYVQAGMLIAGIPEPPKAIVGIMEKVDVWIVKTDMDFAHRFAHTDAARIVERNKGRIASVEEDLGAMGLNMKDILETKTRTEKLGNFMKKADEIRIKSDLGTDITFSIKGRAPLIIAPIRKPGDVMSPLPLWGEIAHSIIEDSSNGTIVANGIMNVVAPSGVKEYVKYKIKNGRAVDITGGDEAKRLKQIIKDAGKDADVLGEFAYGTGHRERWNTVSEKGRLGTIHIALGENIPYPGGKIHAKVHMDATLRFPTVIVDKEVVLDKGVLKI